MLIWVISQSFLLSNCSHPSSSSIPGSLSMWHALSSLVFLYFTSVSLVSLTGFFPTMVYTCQQGLGLCLGFHHFFFQVRSRKHSTVLQLHEIAPPPHPYFSSELKSSVTKCPHVTATYLVNIVALFCLCYNS